MFKLCNYGIVSRVIFDIVSNYFIIYDTYFVASEFL
jgi:hypothetical protein